MERERGDTDKQKDMITHMCSNDDDKGDSRARAFILTPLPAVSFCKLSMWLSLSLSQCFPAIGGG